MAPVPEWEVAFDLVTDQGTLLLNDASQLEGVFMLDKSGCSMGGEVRAEKYPIPQQDGSILRRRFLTGYAVTLLIQYWTQVQNGDCPQLPACTSSDPTSREMNDLLMLHLRSILNGGGRLIWTPTGAASRRMLDDCHLLGGPTVTEDDGLTTVQFTLDSIYPYAIDFTQQLVSFDGSNADQTIDNTGTSPTYPVWKVYGPADKWTILNVTTNQEIVYDGDVSPSAIAIPSGHYAEINTFRNTIYLDGDGANLKAGIDMELTEFFPLAVGDNEIIITGDGTDPTPDVDLLWNPAWF